MPLEHSKPAFPKRIKVGAHWWTVKSDQKEALRLKEVGNYGEADARTMTISIDPTQARERLVQCLWHETDHAIEATWLTVKDSSSEAVVKAKTAAWLQVLRDNPGLVKFILGS